MTIPQTISAAATDLASDGWVRVASIDDLPLLEGRRTTIDGHRVAVFKLVDGLAAIDAVCPHKAGPLQDGLVADNCVTCPLHDRRIDLATGQVIGYEGAVHVHEVSQHGDDVWVRLSHAPLADTSAEADAERLVPGDAMSDPHSSVPDTL
ncbi:MAG: nitrite reductase (NAD(P)H) small subunit [Solirubrobacteraceae bacterium]|nr:nitrite reductase (NAD(P)H) small subunit [Solirubrobacteraceae bacterium]